MTLYNEKHSDQLSQQGLLAHRNSRDSADNESSSSRATLTPEEEARLSIEQLDYGDRIPPSTPKHTRHGIRSVSFLVLGVIALVCLLAVLVITDILPFPSTTSINRTVLSCGDTHEEAARRGCEFDVFLMAWSPLECYDHELQGQYLADGNWTWREDPNHDAPVSNLNYNPETGRKGVWADGAEGRWVERAEFHLVHCAYTWELAERSRFPREGRSDAWVVREIFEEAVDHAHHCGDLWARVARNGIEKEKEYVGKGSKERGFKTCVKLEDLEL